MNDLWDICERKHGGAETSAEANARIAPHKAAARAEILDAIRAAADGMTLDELAERFGKASHKISGRVTELLKLELIVVAGKRKNAGGSTVRVYRSAGR